MSLNLKTYFYFWDIQINYSFKYVYLEHFRFDNMVITIFQQNSLITKDANVIGME